MPGDYSGRLRISECLLNRLSFALLIQLRAYNKTLDFCGLDQLRYL